MLERDIYIDCGNARRKASELRNQADQLRSLVGSYQGAADKIDSAWKGSSAQRFRQSLDDRITSLQKSAARLEELASAIEQTANIYERTQISQIRAERAAAKGAKGGGSR